MFSTIIFWIVCVFMKIKRGKIVVLPILTLLKFSLGSQLMELRQQLLDLKEIQ